MRVLYDARLVRRGLGIATFVTQLAEALVATAQVELIWLGDPALAPAGVATGVTRGSRPYPLLDGPPGRALARRLGVDAIHFTGNTGWGRRGPVATTLTLHDLIFLDSVAGSRSMRQRVGHRYESWAVPRAAAAADVIAVPSGIVAKQVSRRLDPRHAPLVIYEGVAPPPTSHDHRAPERPYLIAFAGRDPRKNTNAVVSAWRLLAGSGLDLKLLAAGGMPPGLRDSLAPDVVSGRVEIHPHIPRARLWSLLSGAVALVYPSADEGFGLPVLEAMAVGTPVLSGVAPATSEIGGDAIVELDRDALPASIVSAVRQLLDDPSARTAIRVRGAARAVGFTWEATAAGYLQAYREAIERH